MTDADLKAAILADPQAKALADSGDDAGTASRIAFIAPKEPQEARHTFLSIAGAAGPDVADCLIRSLRAAISGGSLLLDEIQWSLRSAPGVDVAHPATTATLDSLAALSVPNGLTADDATLIKALGLFPPEISADQVSRVWAEFRPAGKVS